MKLNQLRGENPKLETLCGFIEEQEGMAIAYSGGVDSTFLTHLAFELLGKKMLAITVRAPYVATWEIDEAVEWTHAHLIPHAFIDVGIDASISDNPANRCYLCKMGIFSHIKAYAFNRGFSVVADGSNADDVLDYRPGMKALEELEVKSPLMQFGITKEEIRLWSKELELPTWDKPPYACLLTRLPYGTVVQESDLRMIEAAEALMFTKGFKAVRVRKHGQLARIEISKALLPNVLDVVLMKDISQALKKIGFEYVTLDLEGYEMGSFNKSLNKGGNNE